MRIGGKEQAWGSYKKPYFIVYAAGTMLIGSCVSAAAQPMTTLPRIARLSPSSAAADKPVLAGFREGLRQHGWSDGQNISMEYRFADGKTDRLDELAAELVHLKVDVILSGATTGALAAKRATTTIPIVMVTTSDPVAAGLVTSLARPGGNLTGVTALGQELSGKRLQLLKEALPGKSHIAVLSNPTNPDSKLSVKEVEASASELGLKLRVHEVGEPAKFDGAFRTMTAERAGALMVLTDSMFLTHRKQIVELTAQHRLAAMYPISEFTNVGGLMFYGANFPDMYRRAAGFVDRILKGSKPADLPVQQATKFELVINLNAAKQIGLVIAPSLLARADRVIK
jgi:putative tryptophan/tyrosine transport system substrate-binding protein